MPGMPAPRARPSGLSRGWESREAAARPDEADYGVPAAASTWADARKAQPGDAPEPAACSVLVVTLASYRCDDETFNHGRDRRMCLEGRVVSRREQKAHDISDQRQNPAITAIAGVDCQQRTRS